MEHFEKPARQVLSIVMIYICLVSFVQDHKIGPIDSSLWSRGGNHVYANRNLLGAEDRETYH